MSEESMRKIDHFDPQKFWRERKKDNCFAFQFFVRKEARVEGETLFGEMVAISGRYYPGGQKYSLAELKSKFPKETTLFYNVEQYKGQMAVRTRMGNWQPFFKYDEILAEELK